MADQTRSRSRSRSTTEIPLVGHMIERLDSNCLPTCKEVMCVFFHFLREESKTKRDSSLLTLAQIKPFWEKTSIPLRRDYNVTPEIIKLYDKHRNLMKSRKRNSGRGIKYTEEENCFVQSLERTFDLSTKDAVEFLENKIRREKAEDLKKKLEWDLAFLKDQLSERVQHFSETIKETDRKVILQVKKADRQVAELEKYQKAKEKCIQESLVVELASSESGGSQTRNAGDDVGHSPPADQTQIQKRGRVRLMTKELADALDYAHLSNDQAAKIISATAQALNVDVSELNINRETIRRERERLRLEASDSRKTSLNPDSVLTVHWDGKTLPSLTDKSCSVSREAIIVTGIATNQLLGAPLIETGKGKGKRIGEAVVKHILEWDIAANVKALAFDTTAENTGYKGGAAVRIEQLLEKDLLWLPCRHHIAELVLEAVYHALMGPSKSPEIKIFKDFGNKWLSIDKSHYTAGIDSETMSQAISLEKREILISLIEKHIQVGQPRADYLELLQLSLVFLGHETSEVKFRKPGPMHSARWMAKAIYGLKMSLFRDQLDLDGKIIEKLVDFSTFVVSLYVPYWFSAPDPCAAPRTDLKFLQDLTLYQSINKEISQAAVDKFLGHLWYLSELSVGFAVFDEGLPEEEREKIVESIQSRQSSDDPSRNRLISTLDVQNLNLSDLATTATAALFSILDIETDFFDLMPAAWEAEAAYIKGKSVVASLGVTNDHAERGVKLMQDYNSLVTKKESGYQSLLVNAQNHRAEFPNRSKGPLLKNYAAKETKK